MPIVKKTKCRMKWCYSPLRHEDGTCEKFCTYNTVYVQTNADRIRSMNDEELAEYLFDRGNGCEYCYGICSYQDECEEFHAQEFCIEHIVEWLKKEAKNDDY